MVQVTGGVWCQGSGVAGAVVANGEAAVRTDANGRYALDCQPGAHAFVTLTVPSGTRAPEGFFRPLTADPATVDFELVPAPERTGTCFRLAHITDLHLGVDEGRLTSAEHLLADLRDVVAECAPDLIVASGDLTNRGSRDELEALRQVFAGVQTPIFPLFGGHDGNEERAGGQPDTTFARHFEQLLGPAWYSLDWGGRHLVFYPLEDRFFSAADRVRKQRWLLADLGLQPSGRDLVLVTHTPPPVAFLEEVGRSRRVDLLYGHWHSSKVFTHGRVRVVAVPPLSFGGIDARPRGYGVVEFGRPGAACC
ncbi:MAG: metallophosphoesterase [Candidatus Latescibacterota bacterium]